VANAAVALSCSRRASRYGRRNSPARAGSITLAANPIIVVRNDEENRTRPSGLSRACQRAARIRYDDKVASVATARSAGSAARISAHTAPRSAFRRKNASNPIVRTRMNPARRRERMTFGDGSTIARWGTQAAAGGLIGTLL